MRSRSTVTVLGALIMVACATTAFAQVRTLGVTSVRTVTPVRTMPLRDLRNINLPPILRRIIGNKYYSQNMIAQLRDKLIRSGFLRPLPQQVEIPIQRLKPAMKQAPRVIDRDRQSKRYAFQPDAVTGGLSFPGIGASDSPADSINCAPPDTDMAVGANDVVEITNLCEGTGVGYFKVWNKTTGAVVQGTTSLAGLWGASSGCDAGNGDNIVMYDQFAQRWILTQFNNSITGECVAISQTSDPTGAYYLYNFVIDANGFTDYPKLGLWPNSYFVTDNDFVNNHLDHVNFTALQKSAMLTGSPAQMVVINGTSLNSGALDYSVLPAYVDGMTPPPAGDPGIFVNFSSPFLFGTSGYDLNFWRMSVDWTNPSAATLTGPVSLAVNPFNDGICDASRTCIPEPSPATASDYLDALGDRLMFRLAYRNLGGHQAMVVDQTVGTGGAPSAPPAGIRWYEVDAPAGATSTSAFTVAQQGTYLPADGNSRWMGSIAMDHIGDLGLGFSESSNSLDPSPAFTGQTVGAPSGMMDAGETLLTTGTGVQQGNKNRWGDYSATVVDPTDDCTFWTSQEYMSTSGGQWSTYLGSFKFNNCSLGPIGTVAGTVTASASGSAIAGATVTLNPGDYVATTGPNGSYSIKVPATATAYSATAAAFGYQTSSPATVNVIQNQTTSQDFSLATAPSATLSGTVTDGSGHGYPLYAEVKVTTPSYGQVADLWTAPTTGKYSVNLPIGNNYTVSVTSYVDGYTPASASATLATGGMAKNFALTVGPTCSAPGYAYAKGFGQDFNGATFPPKGWQAISEIPGAVTTWKLNSAYPFGNGNYTGGTGTAADADNNVSGPGAFVDVLLSPPIPVTSLGAEPVLHYKANYQEGAGSSLNLAISAGTSPSPTTISHWTSSHGSIYGLPGENETVDLGPYMPSSGTIQLAWIYSDTSSSAWGWYAQIDDVSIGYCKPTSGGLVEGTVTDSNTGDPLIGATVTDDTGASAKTFANPADPNLTNGLYMLFSPTGGRTLTATDGYYASATANVSVANNDLKQQSFSLKSAQFTADPTSYNVDVKVNEQLTKTLTINNIGNAAGQFRILTIDAPPPSSSIASIDTAATPLRTIKGNFSKAMITPTQGRGPGSVAAGNLPTLSSPGGTASWTSIADLPSAVESNLGAMDSTTGEVYSIFGFDGANDTNAGFVYDSSSNTWSTIANAPNFRQAPTGQFIGGKLYVTGGWDPNGNPISTLSIYDPSSDSWSTGTDDPSPVAGGAASTVLDNKLYVVGGCVDSSCSTPTATVEVYDPNTDNWSSAAPYPMGVTFAQCGTINEKVYCAGGFAPTNPVASGYVYNPASDSWSPIADMPDALAGGGYIDSQGKLLISGGINGSGSLTNEGYAYDPGSNSWSALPNANTPTFRGGSSCGFYLLGGESGSGGGRPGPIASSEVLPGYGTCGVNKIPWLTVAPAVATAAVGGSATVTLTFDGTGQNEFTTSQAYLKVTGSPYPDVNVPVTVTWDPQPINLRISGNVSPTGTVKAGDSLTYTLAVQNIQSAGSGSASQVLLTYLVPSSVTYVASSGDATSCTASSGTVTCDFGTIAAGASDLETILVQANSGTKSKVDSTFTVSAREPDSDTSNNSVTLSTNPNTGPQGPKGGIGGFGWLGLAGLLGLALAGTRIRGRRV